MGHALEPRDVNAGVATPTGPLLDVLSLSRHTRVPLREQLAAQVGAAIRSGRLRPGQRLPSGRWLARRLGVHRNTVAAAYAELTRVSLVRRRPGSGVYVRSFAHRGSDWRGAAEEGEGLKSEFAAFLARQRARGHSARQLDALLTGWRPRSRRPIVVVAEPDPGLRALVVAEIRAGLRGPRVLGLSIAGARQRLGELPGAVVVARPELAGRLAALDPASADLVALRTGEARFCRRLVGSVRHGQVAAVLCVSRSVRRHVRALLAGHLEDRVGLACPNPARPADVERALRISPLVLADVICVRAISALPGRAAGTTNSILPFRVLHPGWILELARYFDVDALARPVPLSSGGPRPTPGELRGGETA